MQADVTAFCHRQSTKMLEYAKDCSDRVREDEFLKMSAFWMKTASAPQKFPARPRYHQSPKIARSLWQRPQV
jgi:hypothetical protein